MSNYVGDVTAGATVRGSFNTRDTDGAPITLAGTPLIRVYKDDGTTEDDSGITLNVDFDSRTGFHIWEIDTSADGTFYSAGADFFVVLTAGTVDSISVVGVRVGHFSIENRSIKAVDDFLDTEIAAILEDTSTTLDDFVDDLETRLTAALATALQAHGEGIGRGVVDTGSTTTAIVFKSVNGAAASGTNDFYNGRHIVFTSGALTLQATSISDYTGASKTATVPALTGAPAEDVTFIIV